MSVEQAELEGDLQHTHQELNRTLSELRGALGESLDWRQWVRRHPWASLLVVALVGARLGRGQW